ncbi:MAG: histidinol phosphatase [Flavobacterium sp.]|nr:MAG: histidinol phosphatase [Flavobacterium sp.]
MLSFLKSKPRLKELLTDHYTDIHSHLLPGIDDGARNIADTIKLAKSFQEIGISQFVTTPHIKNHFWDNSSESILKKQKETAIILEENNINIPFHAAAEYFMDDWFENHFKTEKLLTIKDNFVLVEISYISPPAQLHKTLFDLRVAGYTPILAHPERYLFYHKNFSEYEKLKKSGCLFQLNLLATVGYYGKEVTKITEELLKKGMYNFVGSDVHHRSHIKSFDERIKVKCISAVKEVIKNNDIFKF